MAGFSPLARRLSPAAELRSSLASGAGFTFLGIVVVTIERGEGGLACALSTSITVP